MSLRTLKFLLMYLAVMLFYPLLVDWCEPGIGLHQAACWLGLGEDRVCHFPLWGKCIQLSKGDVELMGLISLGSAVLMVALVATIFSDLLEIAVRKARTTGGKRTPPLVKELIVGLTVAAFVLTPGFLLAAVRISPLMTVLIPPTVAVALVVHELARKDLTIGDHFVQSAFLVVPLAALVGYSVYELIPAGRLFWAMVYPAIFVFLAIGVAPASVALWLLHCQRIDLLKIRVLLFGGWVLVILLLGGFTFWSGILHRGRVVHRLVEQIVANAEDKAAVLTDGPLDDMLLFMLPEGVRIISMAYDRDPEYGRGLADWVKDVADARDQRDLVFAGELGTKTLVEDWSRIDCAGFERSVLVPKKYLQTAEEWDEMCAEIDNLGRGDEWKPYLRKILAVCGQTLGCESSDQLEFDVDSEANQKGSQDPDVVTPRAAALIASLSKIPKGRQRRLALRESIRSALADGTVGLAQVGDALLNIDMALEDVACAERDAIAVLCVNRQDGVASAVVGAVCNRRGDYERAERYLRRAIEGDSMSASANNDLAVALERLGRAEEAEAYARKAVAKDVENWRTHETLASVLIELGRDDEAEGALAQAEKWARRSGYQKGGNADIDIEIDRARILKKKDDQMRFRRALQSLRARKDLSREQRDMIRQLGM